jgi:hypothetical protein
VDDVVYIAVAYWPFLAAAVAIGILVGWWAEATRHADLEAWLGDEREGR